MLKIKKSFILAVEPLLERLRKETKGIEVLGLRKNVTAHADDTALFSEDKEDFMKKIKIDQEFCEHSTAQLNLGKSINITKRLDITVIPRLPKDKSKKYLGYPMNEENSVNGVKEKLPKFLSTLEKLHRYHPNLIERCEIINTLIKPKVIFSNVLFRNRRGNNKENRELF